jgi:hypothetical protein
VLSSVDFSPVRLQNVNPANHNSMAEVGSEQAISRETLQRLRARVDALGGYL